MDTRQQQPMSLVNGALVAGLSGGVAEIIWIALYCQFAQVNSANVARQITLSLFTESFPSSYPVLFGVLIHLALSIVLAALFIGIFHSSFAARVGLSASLESAVIVLLGVWVLNFFLVVPWLNPTFVALLPYGVTLVSKLLFGLAMGLTLQVAAVSRLVAF